MFAACNLKSSLPPERINQHSSDYSGSSLSLIGTMKCTLLIINVVQGWGWRSPDQGCYWAHRATFPASVARLRSCFAQSPLVSPHTCSPSHVSYLHILNNAIGPLHEPQSCGTQFADGGAACVTENGGLVSGEHLPCYPAFSLVCSTFSEKRGPRQFALPSASSAMLYSSAVSAF
jgi:hypothetical protein